LEGLRNCLEVPFCKTVYVFELVQPETLFPALFGRLLGLRVLVDVGDEWLFSPTYKKASHLTKKLIRFLDTLPRFFELTVTSDYLKEKYKKGTKMINGVDTHEFVPLDKSEARGRLGFGKHEKILLSFGNTLGDERIRWLNETYEWVKFYDPEIRLLSLSNVPSHVLALYLGACDLVLFPTGDNPCERACFPIRVGTCLNAERVIATDNSPTEFHKTLKKYECMVTGDTPQDLALNIIKFFRGQYPDYKYYLECNLLHTKKELDWNEIIPDCLR
jgi:hypothetical protein